MCKTADRVGAGIATGGLSEGVRAVAGAGGSPPGAPNYGAYPGLTNEELDAIKKQNISLDQLNSIINGDAATIAQNKTLLQSLSGLYNPDGTLNQAAVDDLKSRTSTHLSLSNEIGEDALTYIRDYFGQGGPGGAPSAEQKAIQDAENKSYLDALNGNYKASTGLQQDSAEKFRLLKEAAAKRGIRIDGDSLETATSESTAGVRMIGEFTKNFDRNVDAEKQSVLQRGGALNLNRANLFQSAGAQNFGLAQGVSNAGISDQLGYFSAGGQLVGDQLAPSLLSYINGQSVAAAPFGQQRANVYNSQVQQQIANYNASQAAYQANQSNLAGLFQLGGTLAGAAVGGPMGARAGGAVGSAASGAGATGVPTMAYRPPSASLFNNDAAGLYRYN